MRFVVYGIPAPQGSKRHVGNGRLIEASKKVAPWREDVRHTVIREMDAHGWTTLRNPVIAAVVFSLPRPKSAPRRVTMPAKYPDIDKLLRSTLDALTSSGAIEDDKLIVAVSACKVFVGGQTGMAFGLDSPGAVIDLKELDSST